MNTQPQDHFPRIDTGIIQNGALITPFLQKILRMIACDKCFGKGYGTKTEFASHGAGDFEKVEPRTWKLNQIVCCDCDRGKALEKLLRQMAK